MRKVIISLAPVEAGTPIDRQSLVEDIVRCEQAGAAICHLHCRRPDGSLTEDTTELNATFDQIAGKTNLILQASTGGVSKMNIEQRCRPLDYWRVESASLNGGTTNLGEAVYRNSFEDIRYCARAVYDRGIVPEIEVFDIGMIYAVRRIQEQVPYRDPVLYNLVFGHQGGLPANMECLTAFRAAVPSNALWGVTHYGRDNWEFLAAALAMGASVVRIGFEDSRHLSQGKQAEYNFQVVEKLAILIQAMDLETASPEDARKLLHIEQREEKHERS